MKKQKYKLLPDQQWIQMQLNEFFEPARIKLAATSLASSVPPFLGLLASKPQ